MSMTVAEARSEIKKNFEKAELIEKRYPDGVITNEVDETEVKRLLTEIDGMEAKLAQLESAEERHERLSKGMEKYNKPVGQIPSPTPAPDGQRVAILSPGDQFINSYEYKNLANNGSFNSPLSNVNFAITLVDGTSLILWSKRLQMQQKALLYGSSNTSGGGFVTNDLQPGYIPIAQSDLNILSILPRYQTSSDTVDYVKETTFTNTATGIAESTGVTSTIVGLKPQSTLAYAVSTMAVRSIAHWLPVTNRMLADAPSIRGIINQRLLLGLDLEVEKDIISGVGTGNHLTGFTHAGIEHRTTTPDSLVDAIFIARTTVRTTGGGRPNAVVVTPANWEEIRLARENVATGTLGAYLMGPPNNNAPASLWGMSVVESAAMPTDTAIVGDFAQGCGLFDREQASIRVGTINDQFIRNQQTILAELRAAFVVFRPAMFVAITGI